MEYKNVKKEETRRGTKARTHSEDSILKVQTSTQKPRKGGKPNLRPEISPINKRRQEENDLA